MISRIFSSDPRFKSLTFHEGLNLVVAEKDAGSSAQDTRNGAGKSSLIEIIHFLLGASCMKTSIFRDPELVHDAFGMSFILKGKPVTVIRSGSSHGRVIFRDTDTTGWPVQPQRDFMDGDAWMSVPEWISVLGVLMFELRPVESEEDGSFRPQFRGLYTYFARRDGGFREPSATFPKQPLWQQQVFVTFLLGLDWTIQQAMQRIRANVTLRKGLKRLLEKQAKDDSEHVHPPLPESSVLKTRLVIAEKNAEAVSAALNGFRVVDEYHALEQEADELAAQLNALSDENAFDRAVRAELRGALAVEAPPDPTELANVYEEAGLVLPGLVTQRFEDVRLFHESVIKNRQSHLQNELKAVERRITHREIEQRQAESRSAEVWATLKSSGALESFTLLQAEYARVRASVERIRQQYEQARAFEDTGRQITIDKSQLESRMAHNHLEQDDQLRRALVLFESVSKELYKESGQLQIRSRLEGPPVLITIPRSRSGGVRTMQTFCFDLTMAMLCAEREIGPGTLIHDSEIFDPTDSRQVGEGLRVAAAAASQSPFQYIALLNTDRLQQIPRWTVQNRQFVDRQNRQFPEPAKTGKFYFVMSSVRKSVWTFVRQLRGPHLSTWA